MRIRRMLIKEREFSNKIVTQSLDSHSLKHMIYDVIAYEKLINTINTVEIQMCVLNIEQIA